MNSRLLELARVVAEVPEHSYRHYGWSTCALAWGAREIPQIMGETLCNAVLANGWHKESPFKLAAETFEITENEALSLFGFSDYDTFPTPKEVAQKIRNFAVAPKAEAGL